MRRPAITLTGVTNGAILQNYSPRQLQLIGSVAVTYNAAESILHRIAGACLHYPGNPLVVTSRVNGTEGLVEIIIKATASFRDLDNATREAIKGTLQGEGFAYLKPFRDAVIHAVPYNIQAHIGRYTGRQAKLFDVLISEAALEWLTQQLTALGTEMSELGSVIRWGQPQADPEHEKRRAEALQAATAQHRQAQSARRSIHKPPEFPKVSGTETIKLLVSLQRGQGIPVPRG